jgi:hypothetical protein
MVTYGWIPDDNADLIKPVFFDYQYNKTKPGVIIEINPKKKPKVK